MFVEAMEISKCFTQIYVPKLCQTLVSFLKIKMHLKTNCICVSSDAHEVEPLLSADWAGDADRTIQRVRLSPSESMLAATLKSNHSEVSRCLIVRLEPCAIPQEPMLILDNVFSFGKNKSYAAFQAARRVF